MRTRFLLTSLFVCLGSLLFAQASTAADTIVKFAHNMPPKDDASYHLYFLKFADLAKKYTNGAVDFQEFPASQMGSDQQAAKKLQLGTLEMMSVASNNLAQLYGGFDLFTLPFLFKSMDCAIEDVLTDEALIDEISKGAQEKANIRILAFSVGGMRNMMNSKHPINTPADLKGLRIRVAKNPIQLDTYKALGADAIGIASAETYGALQTKVVDGHDGGSSWAYAQKLYEVQNYFAHTGHQLVVNAIIVNNDFFEKLPKDVQDGITRAAREAAKDNMQWQKENEEKIYAAFEKAGLKVSHPDLAPFQEAVKPVWNTYADRVGGAARIEKVQQLQKSCK